MKKLVVYYSFDGGTELLANSIAEAVDADVLRLTIKEEIKTHGFMKFFWGGKQVMMREKPELLPLDKNPADYDMIFIGTPVWSFTFTPAVRSFFSSVNLSKKNIALFSCHDGGPKNTLANMKKELVGNTFVGEMDFFNPLKKDREETIKKAQEWARTLVVQ